MIERTESDFKTREGETGVANDWAPRRPMWEARIAATHFLTSSPEEAAARCRAFPTSFGSSSEAPGCVPIAGLQGGAIAAGAAIGFVTAATAGPLLALRRPQPRKRLLGRLSRRPKG